MLGYYTTLNQKVGYNILTIKYKILHFVNTSQQEIITLYYKRNIPMKNKKLLIFVFVFIVCSFVAMFAFYSFSIENDIDKYDHNLCLKAYENTVALYNNNEIEEIYSDIVLNALPIKDQNDLQKGIPIDSKDELLRLLEDFDG